MKFSDFIVTRSRAIDPCIRAGRGCPGDDGDITMKNSIGDNWGYREMSPNGILCCDCKWWHTFLKEREAVTLGTCRRKAPTANASAAELRMIRVAVVDLVYMKALPGRPPNDEYFIEPDEPARENAVDVFPRTTASEWCGEAEKRKTT